MANRSPSATFPIGTGPGYAGERSVPIVPLARSGGLDAIAGFRSRASGAATIEWASAA
jgi:hypothetical protein